MTMNDFLYAVDYYTKQIIKHITENCLSPDKSFRRESEMLNGKITLLNDLLECDTDQLFTGYAVYTEEVSSKKQLEKHATIILNQVETMQTVLKGLK